MNSDSDDKQHTYECYDHKLNTYSLIRFKCTLSCGDEDDDEDLDMSQECEMETVKPKESQDVQITDSDEDIKACEEKTADDLAAENRLRILQERIKDIKRSTDNHKNPLKTWRCIQEMVSQAIQSDTAHGIYLPSIDSQLRRAMQRAQEKK